MDITLWIVQALVALAFVVAGFMMASLPIEKLKKGMNWVGHYPVIFVRVVAILEILGALGLILPGLTHILPWLTPVAAICLTLTMVGAIFVHIRLKEYPMLVPPGVFLVLFVFIAYGRLILAPLS